MTTEIQKLDPLRDNFLTMVKKHNALVGVVNALVESNNIHEKQIDELQMKKTSDPYAEQRKWVGKLCKFWDYDKTNASYSVLYEINEYSEYLYIKPSGNAYKYCEPVKTDDDIIYKGGNNE